MLLLYLLILFTVVPLVELTILVQLTQRFNLATTIVLVVVTGVIGAKLARREGLKTWRRIQDDLAAGHAPTAGMVDGALILLAGAVLVTPGVLTDACGFLLLVPVVRRWIRGRLAAALERRIVVMHGGAGQTPDAHPTRSQAGERDTFIDVPGVGRDAEDGPEPPG